MPKKRSAKSRPLKPWLSANHDSRDGRFIQVGNSLMLSSTFHELTLGARWLYFCMAMESGGKMEFVFTQSVAKKYRISPSSFKRNASDLVRRGFVERVRSPAQERWEESRFRFRFDWKQSDSDALPLHSSAPASATAPALPRTGETG